MSIQNSDDESRGAARRGSVRDRVSRVALSTALALACLGIGPAHAAAAAEAVEAADAPVATEPAASPASTEAHATPSRQRPTLRAGTLDGRIQLLTKELDLSPLQQAQVRKVLLAQREQVTLLWSDAALPAALRVGRTQAIGDHTADQIRALLNEAQRKKYIQPKQRDATGGGVGSDVESWIKASSRK